MYETLDQLDYVFAAYFVGISGTLAMVLWSWLDMRRAERRRNEIRKSK
jgi:hypothetical protein